MACARLSGISQMMSSPSRRKKRSGWTWKVMMMSPGSSVSQPLVGLAPGAVFGIVAATQRAEQRAEVHRQVVRGSTRPVLE